MVNSVTYNLQSLKRVRENRLKIGENSPGPSSNFPAKKKDILYIQYVLFSAKTCGPSIMHTVDLIKQKLNVA